MQFNSFEFAFFFLLVLAGAIALAQQVRARNIMLLAASYVFYGSWDWRFLGLLLVSTVVDYACGRLLAARGLRPGISPQRARLLALRGEADAAYQPRSARDRAVLMLSICTNLGILGFFKYFGFFVDSAAAMLTQLGLGASPATLNVILPVGISFYTFQTMGYTIDVYRGQVSPERNPLNFALYVAFFPQLVAGPIERAGRLLPQIQSPTTITWPGFYSGVYLIFSGLIKKVVLADNVAPVVDSIFRDPNPTGGAVMVGVYAFAIQIYCDFSGYTDIARGTARCMGFELMKNFNLPYLATNPADFWNRWHISLTTWLRDYLYIPLGASRLGEARTYFNIMVVWMACGLWHGAKWTFVVWGLYLGLVMCMHRALRPWMNRHLNPQGRLSRPAWHVVRVLVSFHLLVLAFILFRAENFEQAWTLVRGLGSGTLAVLGTSSLNLSIVLACGALLLGVQLAQQYKNDMYVLLRLPAPIRAVAYAAGILIFFSFGEYYGEQFVYFQF